MKNIMLDWPFGHKGLMIARIALKIKLNNWFKYLKEKFQEKPEEMDCIPASALQMPTLPPRRERR